MGTKVKFEKGIYDTVDWYRNHPDWIKNIKTKEYLEYYNNNYNNRTK